MSGIRHCLGKLVREGRITPKTAAAAQAIHDGLQPRLDGSMPRTHAEAYAALETAKAMAAGAAERKLSIARQAIAADRAQTRVTTHKGGSAAGLMAEMSVDIRMGGRDVPNIEAKTEVVLGELMGEFRAGAEAMRSRWAGLIQDRKVAERMIDEIFGVDSGDEAARQAAKGWKNLVDRAVARARAAGKAFNVLDDWRVFQSWSAGRLRAKGLERFTERMLHHIRTGGIGALMDARTGAPVPATDIVNRLKTMFDDVTVGRGEGARAAFSPQMRVVRFADGKAGADAWRDLMFEFGPGRDIYALVTRYAQAMAREIAFVETWGPDYRATFRGLVDQVTRDEQARKVPRTAARFFGFESARAAERSFKVLTGEASQVESELWAGVMGGLRSGFQAAQLGSAVVTSVFGDSVTAFMAANHNGIAGVRVISRTIELLATDNPNLRADLSRLGLVADMVGDAMAGSAHYADETFGSTLSAAFRGEGGAGAARRYADVMAGAAQLTMRVTGQQAWTEAVKRAFSMEMLAEVASQSRFTWNKVDRPFRTFLENHGFTRADWDELRRTPALDVRGARFFDVGGVSDRKLGERLLAAIIDERKFAVLEPDARLQGWTTQGLPRGTFMREMLSSVMQYKSFPILMLLMHGSRMFSGRTVVNRLAYFGKLAALGALAGAASMQAKAVLQGRDPRPMDDPRFWAQALATGGALGIFGDLLFQGYNRAGTGLLSTFAGPTASFIEQAGQVVFPMARQAIDGEGSGGGAALARMVKSNVPFSNVWFSRLVVDRYIFDPLQRLVTGSDYEESRRRTIRAMQRDYGQGFWFAPGTSSPQRGPNFGNALGNLGGG